MIVMGIFGLCVTFLLMLGKCCGLNYKQISVAFNLWLQGGVLASSAICPSVCWIMSGRFYGFMSFYVLLILILYAVLNVFLYIKMIRHYHLPFEYAFNLCVSDLESIAKEWNCSYHWVNIVLFVVVYLIMLTNNVLLSYLIISQKIEFL